MQTKHFGGKNDLQRYRRTAEAAKQRSRAEALSEAWLAFVSLPDSIRHGADISAHTTDADN